MVSSALRQISGRQSLKNAFIIYMVAQNHGMLPFAHTAKDSVCIILWNLVQANLTALVFHSLTGLRSWLPALKMCIYDMSDYAMPWFKF